MTVSRGLRFGKRVLRRSGISRLWRQPIINFIDIGSAGGLPPPWPEHEDLIRCQLRFEPREAALRTDNIICLDTALWSCAGERDFYTFSGGGMASSMYPQNYGYVREHYQELSRRGDPALAASWFDRSALSGTRRIACETLDAVLAQQPVRYEFVKIDAQGAEYEILKGAETFLSGDCQGLHLELFVIPLYKDIHLLPDVEALLVERGFYLAKKFPAHGSFASQHDCLFLRRGADNRITRALRSVYALNAPDQEVHGR